MLHVGIGEYIVTEEKEENIVTHSLGSCIAFIIRCPFSMRTAFAHIVLPEAGRSEHMSDIGARPAYFADHIVPIMIEDMLKNRSCKKEQLQIWIIGGAESIKPKDTFQIGLKNVGKVNEILERYDLTPDFSETGGLLSRTVEISVKDGDVQISRNPLAF